MSEPMTTEKTTMMTDEELEELEKYDNMEEPRLEIRRLREEIQKFVGLATEQSLQLASLRKENERVWELLVVTEKYIDYHDDGPTDYPYQSDELRDVVRKVREALRERSQNEHEDQDG